MNKLYIYIVFILIVLFYTFSCSKKKVEFPELEPPVKIVDTLFPLEYFPAYPGSYWTYFDSVSNTTITCKTDSVYKTDSYYDAHDGAYTDEHYVPYYCGYPVYHYSFRVTPSSVKDSYFTTFLNNPLQLNSSWCESYASNPYTYCKKIVTMDTTIVLNGISYYPTLIAVRYAPGTSPEIHFYKQYYTKDIGLIKEIQYYGSNFTINKSIEIVDYHINH